MHAHREETLCGFVWQSKTLRLANLAFCLFPMFVDGGADGREIVGRHRLWILPGQRVERLAERHSVVDSERKLRGHGVIGLVFGVMILLRGLLREAERRLFVRG